ncbi:MAG: diguanylate cyclase domain-containing protein [Candidatus Dormibacteraceae bacterium]
MSLGDWFHSWQERRPKCESCGTAMVSGAAFCHSCGARSDDPSAQPLHIVDRLTGLFNDRFLRPALEDELARAHLYGRTLGVLLIEPESGGVQIENSEGDTLLRLIATAVSATLQEVDTPGVLSHRPPSILALLPDTDASGTAHAANKVLDAVNDTLVGHRRRAALGMVCVHCEQRLSADVVIEAAERSIQSGRPELVGRLAD